MSLVILMPPYTLPTLPYALDALSPHISEATMQNHYHQHHQTYINKLNAFIEQDPTLGEQSLESIIQTSKAGPIFNNAAQHWNHNVFWQCLAPANTTKPSQLLFDAIAQDFDSMEHLQKAFKDAAAARFGSGWVWLVLTAEGKLDIRSTPNAENPLTMQDVKTTLIACDVWEHAYYLDTQYNRPLYIDAFWHVINWTYASDQLQAHV